MISQGGSIPDPSGPVLFRTYSGPVRTHSGPIPDRPGPLVQKNLTDATPNFKKILKNRKARLLGSTCIRLNQNSFTTTSSSVFDTYDPFSV